MRSMIDMVLPGEKYRLPDFEGAIMRLDVHSSSRKISARWAAGELHIVTPPGCTHARVRDFLITNHDAIMQRKPGLKYAFGALEFDGITVMIGSQSLKPQHIFLQGELMKPMILVGSDCDIESDESTGIISKMLCIVAEKVAPEIILPRARDIAAQLGLEPRKWKIARGHRTLGVCNSEYEISLSSLLVFLTPELRDYIVCHELAHMTYLDHSAQFHALCDRYCGGRERELIKKLKKFQWPILRK